MILSSFYTLISLFTICLGKIFTSLDSVYFIVSPPVTMLDITCIGVMVLEIVVEFIVYVSD